MFFLKYLFLRKYGVHNQQCPIQKTYNSGSVLRERNHHPYLHFSDGKIPGQLGYITLKPENMSFEYENSHLVANVLSL